MCSKRGVEETLHENITDNGIYNLALRINPELVFGNQLNTTVGQIPE